MPDRSCSRRDDHRRERYVDRSNSEVRTALSVFANYELHVEFSAQYICANLFNLILTHNKVGPWHYFRNCEVHPSRLGGEIACEGGNVVWAASVGGIVELYPWNRIGIARYFGSVPGEIKIRCLNDVCAKTEEGEIAAKQTVDACGRIGGGGGVHACRYQGTHRTDITSRQPFAFLILSTHLDVSV